MREIYTLKELTRERMGSVANLAREMGWSHSKTRRVIIGVQEPTPGEMRALANALKLESAEEIAAVFRL